MLPTMLGTPCLECIPNSGAPQPVFPALVPEQTLSPAASEALQIQT